MECIDLFLRCLGVKVRFVGEKSVDVLGLVVDGRHVQGRLAKRVQRVHRLAKLQLLKQRRVVVGGGQFVKGTRFDLGRRGRLGHGRRCGLRLFRATAGLAKRDGDGSGGQQSPGKVG